MSHPRDQLTAYVLGELSQEERTQVAAHLESCPACREEVGDLERLWVTSVEGLASVAPPAGTWDAIAARVAAAPTRPESSASQPSRAPARRDGAARPWRRLRGTPRWAVVTAASLVVLVGASGWWGLQQRQQRVAQSREIALVARWLTQPDLRRADLASANGTVGSALFLPGGRTLLVLPAPPGPGRSYQAWGLKAGTAVSLGVTDARVLTVHANGYAAVAVSLERRGGSPKPTHVLGSAPVS